MKVSQICGYLERVYRFHIGMLDKILDVLSLLNRQEL